MENKLTKRKNIFDNNGNDNDKDNDNKQYRY